MLIYIWYFSIPDVVPSRDARMLSYAPTAEVGRTQRNKVRRFGDKAAVHDALDRAGRSVRMWGHGQREEWRLQHR